MTATHKRTGAGRFSGQACARCHGSGVAYDDRVVGDELRQERKAAGVTLRQVGAEMNYNFGYISELELGTRRWTKDKIERYLKAIKKIKHVRRTQDGAKGAKHTGGRKKEKERTLPLGDSRPGKSHRTPAAARAMSN